MKVPFLDLGAQYKRIKEEVNPAIQNIIDNNAFILGKSVSDFENKFSEAHNVKHCIGTSSGTDGNHLALWSLGIGHGDEVILPANTFIASAWGITLCGATPVFVDCEPDSYNIDPEKIEDAITEKTKAIVAVHLYGQTADMDRLKEVADKHNLFLVEDAAQAHLAEYKGRKAGSMGKVASFSFYPGKNLGAFGEAGAVTTNDDTISETVKMMRNHGAPEKYEHKTFGHNYRMSGIQGAVLGVKLNHLNEWTEQRRNVAKKYNELLKDVDEIKLPKEMPYAKHVYHLFVIQVNGGNEERKNLSEFLNSKGIASGLHYPIPLHQQEVFGNLGYKKGQFPVSEFLAERILSLPMFPELTDEQIEYVCDNIKEYFNKKSDKKNKDLEHADIA